MRKSFLDILDIARDNVRRNPSVIQEETVIVSKKYLEGLRNEVKEVEDEVRENNAIFLMDELSDIAWDYAVVLALLEHRGYIDSAEEALEHAHTKYVERSPAFLQASEDLWEEVKKQQKQKLHQKHQEKYGN